MNEMSFPPSAGVALLVPKGGGDAAVVAAAAATARANRWLCVGLDFIAATDGPWHGATLPGASSGCRIVPTDDPRAFDVHLDPDGHFLVATIDLLLRTHGVTRLAVVGTPASGFRTTLAVFAALRGYGLDWLGPNPDFAQLGPTPANDRRASRVLPDLAARVAPANAALILIDVQNDFCAADGATGRLGQPMAMIEAAVARIKTLLVAARDAGLFIVHVRAEYGPAYRSVGSPYRSPTAGGREPATWTPSAATFEDGPAASNASVEVCLPGSWGAQFIDGIEPRPGEAVVTKHRFSAFADTGLDSLLRARGLTSVIVAGVTTNCCVETTAREAVMRDFHLIVAEDCVAVKDHLADLHRATLENLALYFGLVRPANAIIEAWAERADGHRSALAAV